MKKSTTHTFNVINISEYHQSQGGGSVHADFSLLGQKWAESGILLFIQYICPAHPKRCDPFFDKVHSFFSARGQNVDFLATE